MTLNGIALILHYFIEVDSIAGRLHHSGSSPQNIVCQLYLAKTDQCSSHTVSLRQLSFLFYQILCPLHKFWVMSRHRTVYSPCSIIHILYH